MTQIKLEVGRKYLNRLNKMVEIVGRASNRNVYADKENYGYQENGTSLEGPPKDLIQEIGRCGDMIYMGLPVESTDLIVQVIERKTMLWNTPSKKEVKVTHIPSGLSATCMDECSEHRNCKMAKERLSKLLGALNAKAFNSATPTRAFNLEAFKAGDIAITRDGQDATFIACSLDCKIPVVFKLSGRIYLCHENGSADYYGVKLDELDLVAMKVKEAPQWRKDLAKGIEDGHEIECASLGGEWIVLDEWQDAQAWLNLDFLVDATEGQYRIKSKEIPQWQQDLLDAKRNGLTLWFKNPKWNKDWLEFKSDNAQSLLTGSFGVVRPKTILINGFEVPEPLRVAPVEEIDYYVPHIYRSTRLAELTWYGNESDFGYLNNGLVHLTKEAAELHAKALLSFTEAGRN